MQDNNFPLDIKTREALELYIKPHINYIDVLFILELKNYKTKAVIKNSYFTSLQALTDYIFNSLELVNNHPKRIKKYKIIKICNTGEFTFYCKDEPLPEEIYACQPTVFNQKNM